MECICRKAGLVFHDLDGIMKKLTDKRPNPFLTLCINHTPINLAPKTIKAHVCSATNPTALPRKFKIASTRLPSIAGNASTAFPASLSSAAANLLNYFFDAPSSFVGEAESHAPPPPPKTPITANAMVEIVLYRAVSIDITVMPCS